MAIQNAVVIEGRTQKQVSAGGASVPLDAGVYDVWAAAETFIAVVPAQTDPAYVTANNGYRIPAGANVPVRVGRDNLIIISTAALSFHRTE